MLELYKNIKNLRKQLGLSQEDLANKVGYTSPSSIAKIEKGEVDLPISKILLFAKSLYTTAADLMGWEENDTTVSKLEQHPLLEIYDNLNNEGQKNLMDYAEYIANKPEYKKCDTISEQEIS